LAKSTTKNHSTGESIHETAIHDLDALYSGDSGIHRCRFGGSGARRGSHAVIGGRLFADAQDCDSASVGADFALIMTGDLDGCLHTFVQTSQSSASGTYRETETELFVASEGERSLRPTEYLPGAKLRSHRVALPGHHSPLARHGIVAPWAGCFGTHASVHPPPKHSHSRIFIHHHNM
jgi:hypothetical protein